MESKDINVQIKQGMRSINSSSCYDVEECFLRGKFIETTGVITHINMLCFISLENLRSNLAKHDEEKLHANRGLLRKNKEFCVVRW